MPNNLWKRAKIDDPIEVTVGRARRLWWLVIFGVIYSFIYTAISLVLMVDLSNSLQDTCVSRQSARTAIRTVLANDPDWTVSDQANLDLNLPVKVKC